MPTMIVTVVPREDAVGELESAARALFAALQDRRPPGIAYQSLREQDGGYLIVCRSRRAWRTRARRSRSSRRSSPACRRGSPSRHVLHPRGSSAPSARWCSERAGDHRGFGESGGRRHHEDPAGTLADLRAAVGFLAAHPWVAADRIGLLGVCPAAAALVEHLRRSDDRTSGSQR
jgi:hypothetical protein